MARRHTASTWVRMAPASTGPAMALLPAWSASTRMPSPGMPWPGPFVDQLLVRKDLTAIDAYVGADYHEHGPNISDGAAGLKADLGSYFDKFPQSSVTPKRVIAEGDLVAVHSHLAQPLRRHAGRAWPVGHRPLPGPRCQDRRALELRTGRARDRRQRQHDVL
ncbi:LOW QUALITY PROTEIN: predicted protein, partial [Streptomyces sviceus ATCC 29083]